MDGSGKRRIIQAPKQELNPYVSTSQLAYDPKYQFN